MYYLVMHRDLPEFVVIDQFRDRYAFFNRFAQLSGGNQQQVPYKPQLRAMNQEQAGVPVWDLLL